jgi:hypothetical protein
MIFKTMINQIVKIIKRLKINLGVANVKIVSR